MSAVTVPNTAEQVALVSAANANQITSALAQAAIQSAKNEDGSAKFPGFQAAQIPFGSTITVSNHGTTALGKLAIGALSAIGMAAALLGLVKGAVPSVPGASAAPAPMIATPINAAPINTAPINTAPPAAQPNGQTAAPLTIEGILNWELTPDGQLNTSVEPRQSAGR